MKFLDEFKEFALKGNVADMAVGIIIGGAFGKIVSSLVADVIMPPIGLLLGGVNFTDLSITLKQATIDATGAAVEAVTLNWGNFIQEVFDFIIIAFAIFSVIKFINSLKKKEIEAPIEEEAPAAIPEDIKLLTEIRDQLAKK
ncbi:MAG: large-conductance mechanosensitive channel protein MscL [Bacteroidales bacterium]